MPKIFGSVPKATQKLLYECIYILNKYHLIEAYKIKHDFF